MRILIKTIIINNKINNLIIINLINLKIKLNNRMNLR